MSILYNKGNSIYETDLLTNIESEVISFDFIFFNFLFTNDNSRVLVDDLKNLRLYDVNSKELLHSFRSHHCNIKSFVINKNDTRISILYQSNDLEKKIDIFDLFTYETICSYDDLHFDEPHGDNGNTYNFEFNDDGSILVILVHNEVVIFNVDNNVVLNRKKIIHGSEMFKFLQFKIYNDEIFIIMRENNLLKVLDLNFNVISEFPSVQQNLYFHPIDKKFIIYSSFFIKEYDMIIGECRDVIQNLYGVHSIFFSSDGSTLAINCVTKILIFDINDNYNLIKDVPIKLKYVSYPRFKSTGSGSYI